MMRKQTEGDRMQGIIYAEKMLIFQGKLVPWLRCG
jgi:hypothetical protein